VPVDAVAIEEISPARAWLLAARPKTLTAALAPVVAGTGLAVFHGVAAALPALAALVGAGLIQIGTNLANDYYDFIRGGDTDARVGPVRVTQAGILAPEQVRRGMIVVLSLAMLVGTYLAWIGGWPIVWIGLASVACAVLYTGGPFPLAYHGLGDVFVFVFFGLVAVGGTYYVQGGAWPVDALLAGVGLGAVSTAILVVNNLRDLGTDAEAGKRTLAVRIGVGGTRVELLVLLGTGLAVPLLGVLGLGWPPAALCALLTGAFMIAPVRTVFSYQRPADLLPTLGQAARVVAVYGVSLGLGLAFG
jgi:1,4-dihydroxy-2-naphthoate polyprenyltransferase